MAAPGSSDANVGMLRTVFDQIDADGNGTLDKDEVAAALRMMGKTEAEVRELVAFMPSEELTFAGFQDLLQGDWYESLDAAGPSRPDRTMSAEERRRRQESLAAASDARGPSARLLLALEILGACRRRAPWGGGRCHMTCSAAHRRRRTLAVRRVCRNLCACRRPMRMVILGFGPTESKI